MKDRKEKYKIDLRELFLPALDLYKDFVCHWSKFCERLGLGMLDIAVEDTVLLCIRVSMM